MLGVGFSEIVIIALVCFIALGPKQLPMVMRKLAGFYRQFTSLRDELKFQILSADREPEIYQKAEPEQKQLASKEKNG